MEAVMRIALAIVALVFATFSMPAVAQTPADPTGHWEGTITAPMGQIDFEIDVEREASGELIAVYGQKAAGLRGLPLTQVSVEGRTLAFVLFNGGPGGGAFKGDVLPDGKTISGDVKATMGAAPFMLYRTGAAALPPKIKNAAISKSLEGRWTGSLTAGGAQVGLILTVTNRPDGTASVLVAQASRPDFQVDAAFKENGPAVSFDVPATSATWTGTFDGDALKGTWSQGGNSLPLTFGRAAP
jgi:hypothetical protein